MYLMSSAMEFYYIASILHSIFIFAEMILLGKQLCSFAVADTQPLLQHSCNVEAGKSALNAQPSMLPCKLHTWQEQRRQLKYLNICVYSFLVLMANTPSISYWGYCISPQPTTVLLS